MGRAGVDVEKDTQVSSPGSKGLWVSVGLHQGQANSLWQGGGPGFHRALDVLPHLLKKSFEPGS